MENNQTTKASKVMASVVSSLRTLNEFMSDTGYYISKPNTAMWAFILVMAYLMFS
jgi:hypothetical protein